MIKPNKILDVKIQYADLDGEDHDGSFKEATLPKDQLITIHAGLSDTETKIILGHELIHYALAKSGVNAALKILSNDTEALEETIVIAIQNHLITTGALIVNPKYFKKGK